MTDERAWLEELARADEEAAAALADLDRQAQDAERIGAEALELRERLASLPAERDAAGAAREDAEGEAEERRREHEDAAAALAAVEGDRNAEKVAAARRDELRARDLAHAAERRLEWARTEEQRLEHEEAEIAERTKALTAEAPAADLEEVAAWATETRAALAVARAGKRSEREALIRQASELGASVLGEPVLAETPAEVARRLAD